MIEIHQQKLAAALVVAIQALVVGALIASIAVGTQDRPSPVVSPVGKTGYPDYRPESTSAAAYPIVGHPPEGMPVSTLRDTGEMVVSLLGPGLPS